jgi:hypothetical protein
MSREIFATMCYMGAAECGLAYFIYRKSEIKYANRTVYIKHMHYESSDCDASERLVILKPRLAEG